MQGAIETIGLITPHDVTRIVERLSAAQLREVYDFALFIERRTVLTYDAGEVSAYDTMMASEDVLRKEWDTPREDEAWANL